MREKVRSELSNPLFIILSSRELTYFFGVGALSSAKAASANSPSKIVAKIFFIKAEFYLFANLRNFFVIEKRKMPQRKIKPIRPIIRVCLGCRSTIDGGEKGHQQCVGDTLLMRSPGGASIVVNAGFSVGDT